MYLNHSDPAVRQRTAKYLCELVDFCADLGGKVIVVGSPKQRNLLPDVTASQKPGIGPPRLSAIPRNKPKPAA